MITITPNATIISMLGEYQEIEGLLGHNRPASTYGRAITSIGNLNWEINTTSIKTLKPGSIADVGIVIFGRVKEFVLNGHVKDLEKLKKSAEVRTHREFGKIIGVGPVTIKTWIGLGVNTMPKLHKAVAKGTILLTNAQTYGLKYYNDLITRIPRDEVTQLGAWVRTIAKAVDGPGDSMLFEIAGSYRRGMTSSGDVDIIISNKNAYKENLIADMLAIISKEKGFISTLSAGNQRVTFFIKSRISDIVRQIDILNIAYKSYFTAINYFTGGWQHNLIVRGKAKASGYRLNQIGLYRIVGKALVLVPIHSEQDIYKILGMDYIPPLQRR